MSQTAVEALMDRWVNEPQFREAVRKDPEGAVRATGLELDADEWAALREIDFGASDEQLQMRISRGGGGT
jgi:hypothetical protein